MKKEPFENKHIREKGGYSARKKRGEAIKEDMKGERVFSSLKMEQGIRSGRADPEFDFMFPICF